MNRPLMYLSGYPEALQQKIKELITEKTLGLFLLRKYPTAHKIHNDKALRDFALEYKKQFLRKSAPVSKVIYDPKIHLVKNALGTHSYVSRVQGNKLKSKNEIRISTIFKKAPEPFLAMIVVHELAHFKVKDHNKAFYQLCCHMLPDYHQLEFDARLYLTHIELFGELYVNE